MIRRLRIFLSSPGDVADEREHIRDLLLGLARGPFVRGRVLIDVVSWDDRHAPAVMDARLTPQEAVNRSLPTPAECDLTIVILWSRMGTPLTELKADGAPYRSGTEWEFENARRANKPVLVYRKTTKVLFDADDPDFEQKIAQKRRVTEFFDELKGAGEGIEHAWASFDSLDDLKTLVEQNVEQHLSALLSGDPAPPPSSAASSAAPPADGAAADGPWMVHETRTMHLFLADAGVDAAAGVAVVACVVVDDVAAIDRQWQRIVQSMAEDPQLHAIPAALSALQRHRFDYTRVDSALRAGVTNALQALGFEAYASITRQSGDRTATYERLVRGILLDRLRAYRTREVEIAIAIDDAARRAAATLAIQATTEAVARLHPTARRAAHIVQAMPRSVGAVVVQYVAEIVRERLESNGTARAFTVIHPNKLRVLFDADAGRYYTRTDPYPD